MLKYPLDDQALDTFLLLSPLAFTKMLEGVLFKDQHSMVKRCTCKAKKYKLVCTRVCLIIMDHFIYSL